MKLILISILLCLSASIFAKYNRKADLIKYDIYQFKGDKTIEEIAKYYYKKSKRIRQQFTNHKEYVVALKKWNQHIEDWGKVEAGKRIYIDWPYPYPSDYKYVRSLKSERELITTDGTLIPGGKAGLGLFYMGSMGTFSEIPDGGTVTIESQQNSPVSIGLSGSFYPNDSDVSFAVSAYLSHLRSSVNNLNIDVTDIPPEIGANFYFQYYQKDWGFIPYVGMDFETFSSFNVNKIIDSRIIELKRNELYFTTIGFGQLFNISKSDRILFKFSFSHIIRSTVSGDESLASRKIFSGDKIIAYLNYMPAKSNFFYHVLYKHHFLRGPTKTRIRRVGAGFGYNFF